MGLILDDLLPANSQIKGLNMVSDVNVMTKRIVYIACIFIRCRNIFLQNNSFTEYVISG